MIFKNKTANILIVIILIVFNLLLLGLSLKKDVELQKSEENLINNSENHQNLFKDYLNLMSQGVEFQNMDDIVHNIEYPFLLYAYSGDECSKCVYEDISILKEKLRKYKCKRAIVFPVLENNRNINIMLKTDLAGLFYKRIDKHQIKFPHRYGKAARFFAILASSDKYVLPYFPISEEKERTDYYLEFVFNKYLKTESSKE